MDSSAYQTQLESLLSELPMAIDVYDQLDSSNSEAMRRLNEGNYSPRLIVARCQTAGKGRRGRTWISPLDSGLYLSIVREVDGGSESIAGLSLVTALSVWQTLTHAGAEGLQLKWPNDILHRGSKLGGILLEMRSSGTKTAVIFGIGINVSFSTDEQSKVDRDLANLNNILSGPIDRVGLIALLVRDLWQAIDQFFSQGFAAFQQTWNRADCYVGREIQLNNGPQQHNGTHCGVDIDGALLLETATGRQRISGGEIFPSLRLVNEETGQS